MKLNMNGKSIWINYHHLYCFFVIATEGSLTRASQKLGIGQSALSIQMRQFEEQLGFPLFERSHRKIEINEQGRMILSYAKEIFRLGSEMIETLHDRPTSKRIHLQVAALDTIPKHFTVALVNQVLKAMPCTVSVTEGKPEALLQELTDHKVDLVITNSFPLQKPGKIHTKRIAKTPLWVVGGKSYLPLKKGFPKSLANQPMIIPTPDSHVRHEFENYCKTNEIKPDLIIETQDLMVQKLLALNETGLSVMPEFAVREYLKKKELHLIGRLEGIDEEIFLISADRKIENPAAAFLMKNFSIV